MEAYCHALEQEIATASQEYGYAPVDTVYLGGGTPSVIPARLMREVLQTLRRHFDIRPNAEFTSEANPGTLTDAWLDAVTEAGANRLSIGVQAAQEHLLRLIGRIHAFPDALEALAMARRHGIRNLNADAMFGLPAQTEEDYLDTLRLLVDAQVTHISAYSLIVEEGTPLAARVADGELILPDEDTTAGMIEQGIRLLLERGYPRYEISNFAKPGYQCRHNLGYWQQKHYVGLGLSAASHLPPKAETDGAVYLRRTNVTDMADYLRMTAEGRIPAATTLRVKREEAMFETVMLGLRMVDGVRDDDFRRLHGCGLREAYGDAIDRLTGNGLMTWADGRIALTDRGLALQNTALMAFMKE